MLIDTILSFSVFITTKINIMKDLSRGQDAITKKYETVL